MRPTMPPRSLRRHPLPYVALVGALIGALLSSSSASAQSSVPARDIPTARVVETALQRAARVWGTAAVLDGGAVEASAAVIHNSTAEAAATGVATRSLGALLTGEAAAAGVALTQAAGLLAASGVALHVHTARSGSIATYGNPYGLSSGDIAFPLQRQLRARRARPPVPNPYPVPEPAPVPDPDEQRPDERRPGRIYATYTRYNRVTGRYYSGRTSAVIDLNQDWELQAEAAVEARHGRRNPDENADPTAPGFLAASLDRYAVGFAVEYSQRYRDTGYLTIRGREQQLIDFHGARRARERGIETFRGGAQSDTAPDEALTENAIRGVARDNPLGEIFHAAANLAFGEIAAYTGEKRFK